MLLDLGTTARLLIQKAQRDWERAACQSSPRWGLSQPELGWGPVRLPMREVRPSDSQSWLGP